MTEIHRTLHSENPTVVITEGVDDLSYVISIYKTDRWSAINVSENFLHYIVM